MNEKKIVEVKHLKQYFGNKKAPIKAVDDISFEIYEGEVVGLVGESGSGKSTTGRSIIGLNKITEGEIYFDGQLISGSKSLKERKYLAKEMQMIFQDPYASLNPRMTVNDIIQEAFDIHGLHRNRTERQEIVYDLLEAVGLNREHATRYPHEFSGGQRQRIGIARALALQPKFIIADEPISALDVSIQAQVVNLLKIFQHEYNLTYLFIAHDLAMVKYISDRIIVMYQGKIVEMGTTTEIYQHPIHPYTRSLLSAVPQPNPMGEKRRIRVSFDAIGENEMDTPVVKQVINDNHHVWATDQQMTAWLTDIEMEAAYT